MPALPLQPCKRPGCRGTTRSKSGYCEEHQGYRIDKRKESRRGKKTLAFYGTAAWQRFRDWYKSSHPLCEDCLEQGITVPAYCVDHIKEIMDGGALLDEMNARSLCRKCHARKTVEAKRERQGRGKT